MPPRRPLPTGRASFQFVAGFAYHKLVSARATAKPMDHTANVHPIAKMRFIRMNTPVADDFSLLRRFLDILQKVIAGTSNRLCHREIVRSSRFSVLFPKTS